MQSRIYKSLVNRNKKGSDLSEPFFIKKILCYLAALSLFRLRVNAAFFRDAVFL